MTIRSSSKVGCFNPTVKALSQQPCAKTNVILFSCVSLVALFLVLFHTSPITAWSYQQTMVASYNTGNPTFQSISYGPQTQKIYIAGGSKKTIYQLSGSTIVQLVSTSDNADLLTEASTTDGTAASYFDLGYFAAIGNTASPISYYLWEGTSGSTGTGTNYGNTGTGLYGLKISNIQLGSNPSGMEYNQTYFMTKNSGTVVFGVTQKAPTNSTTLFTGTSTSSSTDGAIGTASVNVPGTDIQDLQYYNDQVSFRLAFLFVAFLSLVIM